jgi:hypothetical protein
LGDAGPFRGLLAWVNRQAREVGGALVVMDEQGTHMQLRGLDLEELEAQRADLAPDRIVMRRKKGKRKGGRVPYCPTGPIEPGTAYACVPNPKYWD